MLLAFPQASSPPFAGAGELSAFSAAVAWGVATVLFTRAFRKGAESDAVLIKNLGGAVILGLLAAVAGEEWGGGSTDARSLFWLLLSGALGLGLGDWLLFVAFKRIGVGRTMILGQLLPVLTAFLAWGTHGEWLSTEQWYGVLAIVVGGWIAESRRQWRGEADRLGLAAALAVVVIFAIANAMLAEGVADTGAITGAAWRLVGGTLGILAVRAFLGEGKVALQRLRSAQTWRLFLIPSAIGTWTGMALLTAGFKWAPQGVAAALAASTPLISIPLATVVLHEKPGWRGWLGAVFVVAGAMGLAFAAGSA